jgi:hypothetical protein
MRGFIVGGMRRDHVAREELYRHALDVLEWGRSAWKDVPRSDRGTIFDETFCRGVRAMHLEALMAICGPPFLLHPLKSAHLIFWLNHIHFL